MFLVLLVLLIWVFCSMYLCIPHECSVHRGEKMVSAPGTGVTSGCKAQVNTGT